MKNLMLIVLLLIPSISEAGIGSCHDGNGKVTKLEARANPDYYKNTAQCVYFSRDLNITSQGYDELMDLVKNYPLKYIKWGFSGRPELKTQQEAQQADAEEQVQLNALMSAEVDRLNVSAEELVTALVKVINQRLPAGQKITKQEIINQIKTDKGL